MLVRSRSRWSLAALLAMMGLWVVGAGCQTEKPDGEAIARTLISQPGPTFRIAAAEVPAHWTLIAYGDMRFTDPANVTVTSPQARRALVARIASEHPDLLMLSGDVPYDGSVANDYDVYRAETASWRAAQLRVFPAMATTSCMVRRCLSRRTGGTPFPS